MLLVPDMPGSMNDGWIRSKATRLGSSTKSSIVYLVTKACMIRATIQKLGRKVGSRKFMENKQMKEFVKIIHKRPTCKVALQIEVSGDAVLLFFCVELFSDFQNLLVGDVRKMESRDIEVYMGQSKTDQLGYEVVFQLFG